MNEYIIYNSTETAWAVITGDVLQFVALCSRPSVYKSKVRAEKAASKIGGHVCPFYGMAVVLGSKSSVPAKASPVNKNSPYRSM